MQNMISGIRAKVRDVAYPFRMGAGFAGDVNRTHPVEIEPALVDPVNYPTAYGQAAVLDTTSHKLRHLISTDTTVTEIFGVTVRPYPYQPLTSSNEYGADPIGAAVPPKAGAVDVCRSGLVLVQLNVGSADPVKGGGVYIWIAATSGNHLQGGYETAASAGNTIELDSAKYQFNGAPDASGIVELSVNV